jgi:hypothetical protein
MSDDNGVQRVPETQIMPGTTGTAFDRDNLANFYARRHMDIDSGVVQIFHLPTNAPSREIRFLEVNRMISETTPPEPIDFGVDIGSAEAHTLYVLDVTPAQWEAIQQGTMPLPAGWTLEGSRELGRR